MGRRKWRWCLCRRWYSCIPRLRDLRQHSWLLGRSRLCRWWCSLILELCDPLQLSSHWAESLCYRRHRLHLGNDPHRLLWPNLNVLGTATAAIATAAIAVSPAAVSSRAQPLSAQPLSAQPLSRRTEHLLHHHLRPLHRRSQLPELHSIAQLSVELRQQPGVLHHADRARHRKAPDSDLLRYGVWLRLSLHT